MNKRIMKSILIYELKNIPLIVFMLLYLLVRNWETAFIWGGVSSVLYLTLYVYSKIKKGFFFEQNYFDQNYLELNPITTTMHCFLIGGGSMYIFDIKFLRKIYGSLLFSTLFVWLFIVGLFYLIFLKYAFFENVLGKKRFFIELIYLFSIALAAIFSWSFSYNRSMATVVPIVFLIVFKIFLTKRYS
jgi:hypothetical protein